VRQLSHSLVDLSELSLKIHCLDLRTASTSILILSLLPRSPLHLISNAVFSLPDRQLTPPTETTSMAAAESAYGPLPPELWTHILLDSSFSGVDFKRFRLVNSGFKDIVTPTLFRHACYSITETNIANLDNLLAAEELRRNIKTLYIDNAIFIPRIPALEYRTLVASYMCEVLDASSLDPTQDSYPTNTPFHASPLPEETIVEGLSAYHAHAVFQQHFMRGAYHGGLQHLKHALSMLPKLQSIELCPKWVPSAPGEFRDLVSSELLRKGIRKAGSTTRLRDLCDNQVTISPFDQPGSTARSWNLLHLPPGYVKDRFYFFEPPYEGEMLGHSLLPAICASGVKLDSLYSPGLDYPPDNGSVSFETLDRHHFDLPMVCVQSLSRVQGNENVLSSIRVLKLWLDPDHSYHLGPLKLGNASWLNKALRRMSKVEELSIVQVWVEDTYEPLLEMFKLLLKKTPLSDRFSCHADEKSTDDTGFNELIWRPLCDLQGLEVKAGLFPSTQSVHPLHPNPWPKLVKLDLFNIAATKDDLASLMITLAPSLRRLQLEHIQLGHCPCHQGKRRWLGENWRCWDPKPMESWMYERDDLYDAIVMLNKTLQLCSCKIGLLPLDCRIFLQRIDAIPQLAHSRISTDLNSNNLLGRYVLEAKAEGPALWLSQNGYGARD
jgi:hypothetical protein